MLQLICLCRYYEKSIIEQAINQQRSNSNNHWDETKRSIREARYQLSVPSEAQDSKQTHTHQNGFPPKSDTQTTLVPMAYLEKEEMSLELISP